MGGGGVVNELFKLVFGTLKSVLILDSTRSEPWYHFHREGKGPKGSTECGEKERRLKRGE